MPRKNKKPVTRIRFGGWLDALIGGEPGTSPELRPPERELPVEAAPPPPPEPPPPARKGRILKSQDGEIYEQGENGAWYNAAADAYRQPSLERDWNRLLKARFEKELNFPWGR